MPILCSCTVKIQCHWENVSLQISRCRRGRSWKIRSNNSIYSGNLSISLLYFGYFGFIAPLGITGVGNLMEKLRPDGWNWPKASHKIPPCEREWESESDELIQLNLNENHEHFEPRTRPRASKNSQPWRAMSRDTRKVRQIHQDEALGIGERCISARSWGWLMENLGRKWDFWVTLGVAGVANPTRDAHMCTNY